MVVIAASFIRFLKTPSTEVKTLLKRHRKDIETTVKRDFETIDVFLQSVDSKLSWPGPSSLYL